MADTIHDTHRLPHDGAIDADGHVLEPPGLWEEYIDPAFRDRALRVILDENGLEQLEIGGKPSEMTRRGALATMGAMGAPNLKEIAADPERTYLKEAPFGTMDPGERLAVLDAEHIDAAVLYTTVGLLWEAELDDPELSQAYTTAYNRWICEFCSGSPRLVPTAHLSLTDPAAAAAELRRAVGEGAKGGYVAPFTHTAKPLGHPDHDVLFATAQDLDVPLAIHPTFEPRWAKDQRMGGWENVRELRLLASVQASDGVRHQFTTLFDYGVFDRFPTLKVLVLESGGGWIGYWLDRIDAVYADTPIGSRVPLKEPPSHYFQERVWISCDPDEQTIPSLAARFGDRFLWASDFPHPDHTPAYIDDLDRLASAFPSGVAASASSATTPVRSSGSRSETGCDGGDRHEDTGVRPARDRVPDPRLQPLPRRRRRGVQGREASACSAPSPTTPTSSRSSSTGSRTRSAASPTASTCSCRRSTSASRRAGSTSAGSRR